MDAVVVEVVMRGEFCGSSGGEFGGGSSGIGSDSGSGYLGWEIRVEFREIQQLI